MSEPRVRVYVCKPSSLKIGQRVAGWTHDQQQYLVVDETPGVYLEGVTAEDVSLYLELADKIDGSPEEAAFDRVAAALRKAAES